MAVNLILKGNQPEGQLPRSPRHLAMVEKQHTFSSHSITYHLSAFELIDLHNATTAAVLITANISNEKSNDIILCKSIPVKDSSRTKYQLRLFIIFHR